MDDPMSLVEGDLLAYLEGEERPDVVRALATSPQLQARLVELRTTERQLQRLFGGIGVPDPQDLVDVATGQANPRQQLRVAAYLRESARGRADMAALLDTDPTTQQSGRSVWLALPALPALGTRGGEPHDPALGMQVRGTVTTEQSFYSSEIQTQVMVQVLPAGEQWQIQGRVTQDNQPVVAAPVALIVSEQRPRSRTSDAQGFFVFERVDAGTYRLSVTLAKGRVIVPEIVLDTE